jgi:hypothetical protein
LPDDIRTLIASSFSETDATAYEAYVPSDADRTALAATGMDLLKHFPPMAGACMAMSAMHAVMLETPVKQRAYVAVGSLYVGDVRVFGDDAPVDGSQFNQSSPSWDGHAWVMLGDLVADASLFRTARSGKGHAVLGPHVAKEFPKAGMMICKASDTQLSGLRYEARYVLTSEQVDAIARGGGKLVLSDDEP